MVTTRTVPPAVAALAVLAALPAVIARLRGGHDFTMSLQAAAVVAGAGSGFAADDQAANVLASSPTPLLVRRVYRAVGVVVLLAAGTGVALVAARTGTARALALAGPVAVLAAAAGTASALASSGPPDGPTAPGVTSAMGAMLGLVTASALAERWTWIPTLASTEFDRRWLLVGAAGALVALVRSRDPARRPPR